MYLFRKQKTTVKKMFDSLNDIEKNHFAITHNNVTLISSNTIINTFLQLYSRFECIHSDDKSDFINAWDNFCNIYRNAFKRMYDALEVDYNITDNYDKTSEITTIGTAESTTGGTNENRATTEDSALYYNQSMSSSNGTANSNSNSTVTEHTHGNIGTTKSQDMILDEYILRKNTNLARTIVEMFADIEFI